MDMLGGSHPQALQVIRCLAHQLARAMDSKYGVVQCQLCQRLGILLVRNNVTMLGSCIPSFAPQEVDGDKDTG